MQEAVHKDVLDVMVKDPIEIAEMAYVLFVKVLVGESVTLAMVQVLVKFVMVLVF